MANRVSLADFDVVAGNNDNLNGATVAQNQMYPSGVDNAFREMMAELARYNADLAGFGQTVGGTANAITLTVNQPWAALAGKLVLSFKNTGGPNTGAATLTVTNSASVSLGAKAIRLQGDVALTGGEMVANGTYLLRYDPAYNSAAGAWVLLNPATLALSGGALGGDLNMAGHLLTNVGSINGGALNGFRNKVINGDFDFWQRGTSFTPVTGAYTADRWLVAFDGSGSTRTISKQAHTLGQTAVPGNPVSFLRFVQSVAGTGTFNVPSHRIEGVQTLAGKTCTLTFYAKFASAASLAAIVIRQNFGTGGSPSTTVSTTIASAVAVGTTFQKVQYTFTMPSISGKTVGTNGDDHVEIQTAIPFATTFTFDLSHVSLVEGDATSEGDPFSPRPLQQELALCQRYAYVVGGDGTFQPIGMGEHYSSIGGKALITFPVKMRTSPSFSFSAASNFAVASNAAFTTVTALSLDSTAPGAGSIDFQIASGGAQGAAAMLQAGNINARMTFSAEL
jgi:hypothetical protein